MRGEVSFEHDIVGLQRRAGIRVPVLGKETEPGSHGDHQPSSENRLRSVKLTPPYRSANHPAAAADVSMSRQASCFLTVSVRNAIR